MRRLAPDPSLDFALSKHWFRPFVARILTCLLTAVKRDDALCVCPSVAIFTQQGFLNLSVLVNNGTIFAFLLCKLMLSRL